MMFHLPPPPRFTLPPPPPALASDVFDTKLLSRLSCSSIRQQQQQQQYRHISNSRLIMFSGIVFVIVILLLTLIFILIQFYRQRKSSFSQSQPLRASLPNVHSKKPSMTTSRSYETISSQHTGIYVDSIDTSATTCSTAPSSILCLHQHQDYDYSTVSLPSPYYHTLDILPS